MHSRFPLCAWAAGPVPVPRSARGPAGAYFIGIKYCVSGRRCSCWSPLRQPTAAWQRLEANRHRMQNAPCARYGPRRRAHWRRRESLEAQAPLRCSRPLSCPAEAQVVVTAASAGIGLATAKAFLAADPGCVVAVTTRDRARLLGAYSEDLHARLRVVVSDDFADPTKLEEAARACVDALDGEVDVLVNNLGAATLGCSLDKTSAADLMWHVNINVTSALIFTQACTEALCRSSGAIVNLSSIAGENGLVRSPS